MENPQRYYYAMAISARHLSPVDPVVRLLLKEGGTKLSSRFP